MPDETKPQAPSKFNFFAILEDTIAGVIDFALRFISVTLLCLFRPGNCVTRYQQTPELPGGVFPRPYTYLVMCIFIFLKGLYWISQTTPAQPEGTAAEHSALVRIHSFVEKLGDISTVQIILSVFPTIVVILFLSLIVTLLHRPFVSVNYRQASHAFSYIFGAQIMGVLFLFIVFTVFTETQPFGFGDGAAVISFLLGALALIVVATLALRKWYGLVLKRVISRIGIYLLYTVLSIGIAIAYFMTVAGAYQELESSENSKQPRTPSGEQGKTALQMTVYQVTAQSKQVNLSILLDNRSEHAYLVHDRASAMLMNLSANDLDALNGKNKDVKVDAELIHHYLELLQIGFLRVDLHLKDVSSPQQRLIRPGEQLLLAYTGPLQGNVVLSKSFTGEVTLPVARFNADGSLHYSTIRQELGATAEDISNQLSQQKASADKKFDQQVIELQKQFDETREEIKKTLETQRLLDELNQKDHQ